MLKLPFSQRMTDRPSYAQANNYDEIAESYGQTDTKPDKLYSILPTVLALAGDLHGKICVDAGCGNGFFARALRNGGASVIGIDNSSAQIALARKHDADGIDYRVADLFTNPLPTSDIFVAPFVLNFPTKTSALKNFLENVFHSLSDGGKIIAVVDLPDGQHLRQFGAEKTLNGNAIDETPITIDLFNENTNVCTLTSTYFTPQTIERLLTECGFTSVTWHRPIISDEGLAQYGKEFWKGYVDHPELGYVTAMKP